MKLLLILKNQYFWLFLIIIIAFYVRLYKISSPIADWHSWRQADTAAVTRNFLKTGLNPLMPKYDDMSGVAENPLINPNAFRFVEFPVYNLVVYPIYKILGVNDTYHRLVSVFFSLGSLVFIFLIAKKYLGVFTGLLSALIFGLLPFSIFFSRTTLPEPTFLMFALGMIYFCDRWIEERKIKWGMWAFIFTVIAFLMKPWAIFFIPPLIYSIYKRWKVEGGNWKRILKYITFFTLALTPFILWRLWILQQPEGIPASNWLLNGDGIRFRPAFFWWIVSQRIGGEILGVTGIALFIIGIILKPKNGNYFLHWWLVGLILYFATFATGNVRHNYYQTIFVPIAAIFLSNGVIGLINSKEFIPRIWRILLVSILLPLTFYFTWKQIGSFYQINNPIIVEAGNRADQILPKEAIVVAPYNGDTAFLYQTNRAGFPVTVLPLMDLVTDYGVTHYISTTKDAQTNWVLRHFQVLEDKNYVIADLTKITIPVTETDPQP